LLTEEKIDDLLKQVDLDDDEIISPYEIKKSFTKFGKDLSEEDLKGIMDIHDTDGDGYISKEEFKAIFY
jgi:Ca2+-binding EF-hand superfamily protein